MSKLPTRERSAGAGTDPVLAEVRARLLQIASLMGRIGHLASRYDPATGRYAYGGAPSTEAEALDQCLGLAHRNAFEEWLAYSLEQQHADLEVYLRDNGQDIRACLRLDFYARFVPPEAFPAERRLFFCDLEALLAILRIRHGLDQPRPDWRVARMFTLAEERCGSLALSLKALSPRLRLSPERLGRLFKRGSGVSYHRYLRDLRIRAAAELLRDPLNSVLDVAQSLGYGDASNFVREFRQQLGLTPGHFRAQWLQKLTL